MAPIALAMLGLLTPLTAGQTDDPAGWVTLDSAPEPATFAVIGGALCLLSLKLRRRKP